jgi:AbrB family looped-hinge helix DNA binding protein
MVAATITSKGQITIPKKIRQELGLQTGDRIAFKIREDGVVEIHPDNVDIMSLHGILKPKKQGISITDMRNAIASEASKT